MGEMPRPRPPHLHREVSRHGRAVWYVRIGKGPRIRIRPEYGSPEFDQAYRAALQGETPPAKVGSKVNTLAWLSERYRESAPWAALSTATRRQRENVLIHILSTGGREAISRVDRAAIMAGIDRRRDR